MLNFYAWHIVQALGATANVVLCRLVFVSLNVSDGGQIDYPRSAPFVFLLTDSIQLLIIPGSISCIWSHFYIIIFFHLVTRSQDELYFLVAELWRTISLHCKSAVVISFRHIAQNSFSCTSPIHIGFHPAIIAALRSKFSLSAFIIIKVDSLIPHRIQNRTRITIKVNEEKIRITIRIRPITILFAFFRKLIPRPLIVWRHLQMDRRSSLTRLILNTNTNKKHLSKLEYGIFQDDFFVVVSTECGIISVRQGPLVSFREALQSKI